MLELPKSGHMTTSTISFDANFSDIINIATMFIETTLDSKKCKKIMYQNAI